MRRTVLALVLTGATILPAASASAATFIYEASLSGANEFPANGSPGTGFTRVTYDDLLHTLRVEATFAGLTGNTTAAHIHVRFDPGNQNGGVATQTPTFSGFPLGVQAGSYDSTFDLTLASSWNPAYLANPVVDGTVAGAEAQLFAALQDGSRAYLNIHTNAFPGGELRGNLVAAPASGVPEPATWAMLLIGFGFTGAAMRHRRKPVPAIA